MDHEKENKEEIEKSASRVNFHAVSHYHNLFISLFRNLCGSLSVEVARSGTENVIGPDSHSFFLTPISSFIWANFNIFCGLRLHLQRLDTSWCSREHSNLGQAAVIFCHSQQLDYIHHCVARVCVIVGRQKMPQLLFFHSFYFIFCTRPALFLFSLSLISWACNRKYKKR